MERGRGGESPNHKLTTEGNINRESYGQYNRPHEELVTAFRAYIQHELTRPQEVYGGHSNATRFAGRENPYTPERIISDRLGHEAQYRTYDDEAHKRRGEFFSPINKAWDVIAYERYDRFQKHLAGCSLSAYYERGQRGNDPHPETIRLSHPLQVRILDALADVVGFPHQKGRAEIEIPEQLRNYNQWLAKQRQR